jgi:hypothetical protein
VERVARCIERHRERALRAQCVEHEADAFDADVRLRPPCGRLDEILPVLPAGSKQRRRDHQSSLDQFLDAVRARASMTRPIHDTRVDQLDAATRNAGHERATHRRPQRKAGSTTAPRTALAFEAAARRRGEPRPEDMALARAKPLGHGLGAFAG